MIDPSLLPALYDVLTVARRGSVAAASRALHKTPSAVSQQVRRVEDAFNVRLLERAGRGVRLSAAGEAALGPLGGLFDKAEAVYDLLGELAGSARATVRLAGSDYLGKDLLAPVVRAMAEAGAPLRFEILTAHSAESVDLLERGEVDMAVITSRESRHGLDEKELFRQRFYWIAPQTAASTGPLADRLTSEPVIRLAPGSLGRRVLDDYLAEHGVRPVSTIDVPTVPMLASYVEAGVGIGLVPGLALRDLDRSAVAAERADVPDLPVKLVLRAAYRSTPTVESFLDRLIEHGRSLGAKD